MKYYSIGEFADKIGKTIQTLRNWDKNNTFKPAYVTTGGTRYYSSEEACSELEKTLTAAVMKWLEKHSLKPDFYESISSVQAHGIDDYFKKK